MENSVNRIESFCYVGETKYKAGIFLGVGIAQRKPYFKHLHLKKYCDYQSAERDFWQKYGSIIEKDNFRLNHLYDVRKPTAYSVYYTPFCVGMTYTESFHINISYLLPNYQGILWERHNLSYEDSVSLVQGKLLQNAKRTNSKMLTGIIVNHVYFYRN